MSNPRASHLKDRIAAKSAAIGIVGLGYVGLPLAQALLRKGFPVIGVDVDPAKVEMLASGTSYIRHLDFAELAAAVSAGTFRPTVDMASLAEADAILICVPTPLTKQREPDLRFIVETCKSLAPHLRPGQLVILESTTYPGTTREVVKPILEAGGLRSGEDFFLAFSPEREDPGNTQFETSTTPKVVGGDGPDALDCACALYGEFVVKTVPVKDLDTAEAVKITENVFRAVNIALVNELKLIYAAMGIDVWDVIEAAKTKPFGYMPFYPGPGLGGHCIPIDPFYLTWKAREYEVPTRFIELAGEINAGMVRHVVGRLAEELNRRASKGLNGAKILLLGLAYKKNVDDVRESPALRLIELLEEAGATVDYHDPFVPSIRMTRKHGGLAGRTSQELTPETLAAYDAAVIVTDHDPVDYGLVVDHAKLVLDTRNACAKAGRTNADNVAKA